MSQHPTVDLTRADEEPIHTPGSIQPHGILFALKGDRLKIVQVSNNTLNAIGIPPHKLLGRSLKKLLDAEQVQAIQSCLAGDFESVNPLKISIQCQGKTLHFDGIVHRADPLVILELEPLAAKDEISFLKFYHLVKGSVNRLQRTSNLGELCGAIAAEIQKISGFDRVMVYRFDAEDAGTVVAEARNEKLSPLSGLRFPATDIAKPARRLFSLNWLRLIPDVRVQPVELIPRPNPVTQQPLDLTFSVLRSVSPCFIQYLKNMGVTATMAISLRGEQKLWGLIACHHASPKHVSYEIRTACEFLAQVMSVELAAKEDSEDLDYKMKLKSIQSKFVESISQADGFLDGLVENPANLLDLVGAQGVAIYLDGRLTAIGETPQLAEIQDLIGWVATQIPDDVVFHKDSLVQVYPVAESFKNVASGILALAISKLQKNYIIWFRPEVIQTVDWGGDPAPSVVVGEEGEMRLRPRASFELWQETVRFKSLPWKPCEIEAALELRSAIVSIVLRKADELAKINVELERSNTELDAFAYIASHDLKEPLRGIHNYSSFLIEDYADVLNEEGVSKLQTLMRLTQRMEVLIDSLLHFSRLGRVELLMQATNLNKLVANVMDLLSISLQESQVEIRIPRPLPTIRCDRVQVSEVFSNLIGNAIKYNDKSEKWVEIGWFEGESVPQEHNALELVSQNPAAIVFYVRDNGIGIREKHKDTIFRIFKRLHALSKYGGGTGVGLTIAKKIVERHDGRIWVESTYGEGSTFYFTLQG